MSDVGEQIMTELNFKGEQFLLAIFNTLTRSNDAVDFSQSVSH